MTRRIVVATKNPDKLSEVRDILTAADLDVELVTGLDWPDVAETEPTLEGNALLKARAVAAATGLVAVADDTGLEVDALGGAPGVHTARFSGPDATYESNRRALLAAMEGSEARTARFRTAIALVDPAGGDEVVVEGVLEGEITRSERGAGGFGYDSVFAVAGRTLAEMPDHEKNQMSHRYRALRALIEVLER